MADEYGEFILLPERGLRGVGTRSAEALFSMSAARSTEPAIRFVSPQGDELDVVDSAREDGPKLVRGSEEAVRRAAEAMGVRVAPVVTYRLAQLEPDDTIQTPSGAAGNPPVQVEVVSAASFAPVAGATVKAFTNFDSRVGASGVTDHQGRVSLALGPTPVPVERLSVEMSRGAGFWGRSERKIFLRPQETLGVEEIDFNVNDILRHYFGQSKLTEGDGVTVGVLDTGIDSTHPDLVVSGGRNTVKGEAAADHGDNGFGHGTHVAGIIAARGQSPGGLRGIAPAVRLLSYRVFGKDSSETTNYQVIKAMIRAVEDELCDIVNLSLGGLSSDEAMRAAVEDAFDQGSVVVAASGNDGRKPVTMPARLPRAIAVSAFGRRGTFPAKAYEEIYVDANPPGSDPDDFIASFSNIGNDIFLTGPGVGVLSTEPNSQYGPRSGTSMAAPAAAAMIARLIANNSQILNAPRDAARSTAIQNLIRASATSLGFPLNFQGEGALL